MDSVDSKIFWDTLRVIKSILELTTESGVLPSDSKKGKQRVYYKDGEGIVVGEVLREPPNPTKHYINYTYITTRPELWEKVKEVS